MATKHCPTCAIEPAEHELESGICDCCGRALVSRARADGAMVEDTSGNACALCAQNGASDCFLRGVIREGGPIALPHQSKLRFYYVKCPVCDACFQRVARFNRIRVWGLVLALVSLALGLGGLPLLDWLADTTGFVLAMPRNLQIGIGVVGVIGMFVVLGVTSQWVRNNQGTILNPRIDRRLRELAQVDHWTGANFPNFTRRPIDDRPHHEL